MIFCYRTTHTTRMEEEDKPAVNHIKGWAGIGLLALFIDCLPEEASAEEDKKGRRKKKTTKPRKQEKPPPKANILFRDAENHKLKEEFKPQIKPLGDLFNDAKHLCKDPSKPCRCKGPSEAKLAEDMEKQRLLDHENPFMKPNEQTMYNEILARLQPVELYVEMDRPVSSERAQELISSGTASLPTLTASFESRLLCEAGKFPCEEAEMGIRDFPPCKLGYDCRCRKDFGFICMAILWPDEYETFMNKNQLPPANRICVLDHRCSVSDLVYSQRQQTAAHSPSIIKDNQLLQQYRNMSECKEGYYDTDILKHPASARWEGMIGALATYRKHRLLLKQKPSGQRFLDQSAMVWRPPPIPIPQIGETNRDF